ncbi:hypothetical protein D4R89_01550 [bacterium]|nr:MAG: hypothetical protein D4R89_01550 [bacterium]
MLALAVSLRAQSVVDLSQREKARRESLKGIKCKFITNSDLAVIDKIPAVVYTPDPNAAPNAGAANPEQSPAPDFRYGDAPIRRMVPNVVANGPRLFETTDAPDQASGSGGNIEAKLKAAKERVELLTTNMNALWQQFYNMNTMGTRDKVQIEIGETYNKLLKAQEEEATLKTRLEAKGAKPTSDIDHAPRP